jgi:predicted metal-dependent HD superfamily phosphohydrolase
MTKFVTKSEEFVKDHFAQNVDSRYTFHSFAHTRRTVKNAILLGENSSISASDLEIVNIAALFHDCGIAEMYEGHEDKSMEIAKQFLEGQNYPAENIEKVIGCINSTKPENNSENLLEKILHDANLIHLGKKNYFKRNKELLKEWKNVLSKSVSNDEWIRINIKFISENDFETDYAQEKFGDQRLLNLSALQESMERLKNMDKKADDKVEKVDDIFQLKSKRAKTPDRGIETMFRLTSKNHFTLSAIADNKASTLISISALIISIIVSVLVRKLQEDPSLIIPTVMILITLMGTIIYAVLSTRPKVTSFTISREDITQRKGNLLFFGNFINMPVEDYEWGIKELMEDRDYLYNNLIRDIYYLGVVLGKKYRFLRFAYNIFMYGLIVSVILYIIAFAL